MERANRTIRTAIKKTPEGTRSKLGEIIRNYNNIPHRGTGFSPNDALKVRNYDRIKANMMQYLKEFDAKQGKKNVYAYGDKVIMKNEQKRGKMENEFESIGEVVKHEYGDIYQIRGTDGKVARKHVSQLKRI